MEEGCDPVRCPLLFRLCGQVSFFLIVECSTSNSLREKSNMCEPEYVETMISEGFMKFRSAMLELRKIKAIAGGVMDRFYCSDSCAHVTCDL